MTVGPAGKGKQVYEHRAVAYGGTPPRVGKGTRTVVDHKDRNTSNNKRSNLRVVSKGENNRNRG